MLERLEKCHTALDAALVDVAAGGGEAASPATWIKGDRANLLLYNPRHVQHHTGRLHGTFGRRGVQLEWHG
jgi:hypothetical protein